MFTTKLWVKSQITIEKFIKDQRGVTAVEYAIIAVAMSAIVLAVFKGAGLEAALKSAMSDITKALSSASTISSTPAP
ncbi:Flp family type IVb pilin [Vibrio cincinnatiensis]|uniref:Flp family type IVb pilin n=1 Tax=Vibrio cincinnatiensis TaxID=675 RepID=UPI001EE0CBB7|nr:Flp family type IVb pilin [Vibrio cincinnatiensis]MCG3733470.1 Flp family type IVb pilin [Vibrio cincinnatiensis]MCG3739908.1 Flp family type IVb pilin [Vibrio cincinnatiensis]